MNRILHVFNEYLPKTEVWAFQLIHACQDTDHFIFADYYINLDAFEKNVTLLYKKRGLIKKRRAEVSQYDFPYNMFEPLVIIRDMLRPQIKLNTLIVKYNIEIVHVHFGTTAVEQWDQLKDIEVPFIVSFYGWDYQKAIYYNPSYKNIYSSIFAKAVNIIVEGSHGKSTLVGMAADPTKVKILPLGISVDRKATQETFRQTKTLRLIQIASLSEKKGQTYTLHAFEKAVALSPIKIELTLVGDDRDLYYAQDIKKYIEESEYADLIEIKEWIDFEELDAVLLDHDVFIHPSVHAADGDCEGGSPVILLHAQSVGLPVISTRHCDIPEQVSHGETGFLVEEGDVDALAQHIVDFAVMREDKYFELSKNCIKFVKETFDVNNIGTQLNSIYTELLN